MKESAHVIGFRSSAQRGDDHPGIGWSSQDDELDTSTERPFQLGRVKDRGVYVGIPSALVVIGANQRENRDIQSQQLPSGTCTSSQAYIIFLSCIREVRASCSLDTDRLGNAFASRPPRRQVKGKRDAPGPSAAAGSGST